MKAAAQADPAAPAPIKEPQFPWRTALPGETKLGVVADYFSHIGVFAITLEQPLAVGSRIHLHGHTTDVILPVISLQLDHQVIERGSVGDTVGVRVSEKCRKGDYVFLCS